MRELSDIREASGSSKDGRVCNKFPRMLDGSNDQKLSKSTAQPTSQDEAAAADIENTSQNRNPSRPLTPRRELGSRATSALSLPINDVPERRSSASFLAKDAAAPRSTIMNDSPSWKLPSLCAAGQIIPPCGNADSPVRNVLEHDPVSSDTLRSPSKTFVRTSPPLDILDLGNIRHGRVDLTLQTSGPLFVGGGTIEGLVLLTVDGGKPRKTKPKPLFISRLSLDVVGVEEATDGRRWIFLSLGTELFGKRHPPPPSLVASQVPLSGIGLSWPLQPASAVIPFSLNLPLNIGPPPYASKQARIRYLLCATAYVKGAGKLSLVRQSFEIQLLTVYDPEKALSSLPTPLLATDELTMPHWSATQNIKLTAGLHRQTWVNGAMIFVDVHIMNNSSKTIKKIEIQLEKTILWYAHAAAGTTERSATHLRLAKRSDSELVCTSSVRKSKEWKGVPPSISEVRTCDIEVPRGHVTISTGRYFEVRYFLNVVVTVAMFKTIAVQLPVTIIHINSLDIVPNSLAQVAASIEAKRARTVPVVDDALYPPFHQGQAFTAPRRQSLERMRRAPGGLGIDDMVSLTRDLDASPRRFARASNPGQGHGASRTTAFSAENNPTGRPGPRPSFHHHHQKRHDSCYHCHLQAVDRPQHHFRRKSSMSSLPGPKLPRLQLSTSALGFSDSEFEIAPDSPPRKVMLSESERKLILQQRELRLQRQLSRRNNRSAQSVLLQRQPSVGFPNAGGGMLEKARMSGPPGGYWGWRNVAAQPLATPAPAFRKRDQDSLENGDSSKAAKNNAATGDARSRSNTGPGRLGTGINSSLSMSMPSQSHRRAKENRDCAAGRESGGRMKMGSSAASGGGGRGFRRSAENW